MRSETPFEAINKSEMIFTKKLRPYNVSLRNHGVLVWGFLKMEEIIPNTRIAGWTDGWHVIKSDQIWVAKQEAVQVSSLVCRATPRVR